MIPILALLALPGSLRISEVMIDPSSVVDNHGEFVELQAVGEPADLEAFRIVLPGGDTVRLGMHRLEEGGTWVIGHVFDPDNGGFQPDSAVATAWSLPNSGGRIELIDARGSVIDTAIWDRSTPGVSLERCPGDLWKASTVLYGTGDRGTPGFPNSCDDTPLRQEGSVDSIRRDGDTLRVVVRNRGTESWSGRTLEITENGKPARSAILDLDSRERLELAFALDRDGTGRARWVARLDPDGRPRDDSLGLWVREAQAGLVISEIQPADPGPEWIELAQAFPEDLDLSGWSIGDQEPRARIPVGAIVPAAGRLVLSPDCPMLRAQVGVSGLPCASPSPWPRLSVVEDGISLRDTDGSLWDSVSWSREGGAWPKGRTRERQDLSAFGTVDSWLPSANEGGTPGYGPQSAQGWSDASGGGHSLRIQDRRMRIGDATHRLRLEIQAQSGEILRIDVHDMGRRRAIRLHDGPPPRNGVLLWDGLDADGRDLKPGVYIVTIECGPGRRVVWRAREWIVVAPR